MSGTTAPESFSDNFWRESSKAKAVTVNKRKRELGDFFSSVDDTPDFHDPYSDLSLFLSQRIKQEMQHCGNSKKWSLKLQEDLLSKIAPEFQKKFPHYRLGVTALRKTWDKVCYFSQQIESQKEAITQEGKLNIHFFIKENLKQLALYKLSSSLPPYHYAHQLAVKMSECIAALDGVRPKLDQLTKTVWAVQRHLIPQTELSPGKNPYEEYDKVDKLIVKAILEITARDPQISQSELETRVKEKLRAVQELPSFASLDRITCNISSLLAEKLYPSSAFHTTFPTEEKRAILNFIRRQIQLCKGSTASLTYSELVRRILALYALASRLPKQLTEEEFKAAIHATYTCAQVERPSLPQAVYAFISAESILMKNEDYCHSVDYVVETIFSAYSETRYLPELKGKETEILEIVIWKMLNETEGLLEQLPYKIGQRIEEEIASVLIDNPTQTFGSIVHFASQFFKRIKQFMLEKHWSEIERKIHNWTIQGDMLCRSLRMDLEAPLLKLVREKWKSSRFHSHELFVSEIAQQYLHLHPQLASYSPQLLQQIWIVYKYHWYTLASTPEESSFDRFLKWHSMHLATLPITKEQECDQLEEICKRALPSIPFDRTKLENNEMLCRALR
jgi:hypothetical protein